MSSLRSRALLAAGMTISLLCGLAVAESTGATTPDDTAVESIADATPDTVADTSVGTTTSQGAAVEILPPEEPWAGLTRGEWEVRLWQWVVSLPADVNPNVSGSSEFCGYGQFGPMFFLPGSFEGPSDTTCVVAEGTAIYASAGGECSTVEPPPFFGRTEEELRACATAAMADSIPFRARINGQDVGEAYPVGSPLITLTFPENNVFGVEPGVAQAVAQGYSFIIAPPPPGEHEIVFFLPGDPETPFGTVTLIVEAPQVIEPPPTT